MTGDHLPRIHRLDDGLYTPIGYNGRGIAPGTVFGKAMAELIAGGREEDLPMPVTGVKSEAMRSLKAGFYQAAFSANQLIKSF
jgi:glycine/D-amino acid oxidase-like deaminating enzyme